jgi:glutathione synthase/RimK-type ligase-like ATP-grasp enzyme
MATYLKSYNTRSEGANAIADALGIDMLGRDIDILKFKPNTTIINWGCGGASYPEHVRVINKGEAISRAVNKLETFKALEKNDVNHPDWTTSYVVAASWIARGFKVCARMRLEGKDGEGLILCTKLTELPRDAKAYTKFVKASAEYRINVCNDTTMGVQLKVQAKGEKIKCNDIRTGGNGYGFELLDEADIPKGIRPVARAAVSAVGLDFGGVDLIVAMDGTPYVLEVNTAPELTPAMVKKYASELASMI